MPWIIGGAALLSGALGADASKDASKDSGDAAATSIAENKRQFNTIRRDTAPFRSVGKGALYELADIFGLSSPESRERSTELKQLNERLDSINSRIADWESYASGGSDSGSGDALKGSILAGSSGGAMFGGLGGKKGPRGLSAEEQKKLDDLYKRRDSITLAVKQFESQPTAPAAERPGLYDNLEMDPGYDFRLAEGEKAIQRQQSAGGTRYGGAALKAAARYGQDYSSNEFSNAVNRRNAELGYLFSLAGFGESGIQTAGQAGQNAAANNSSILMQNAQNQGAYGMQGASAINNAVQGGIQNYYTQSLLKDYNRPSGQPIS